MAWRAARLALLAAATLCGRGARAESIERSPETSRWHVNVSAGAAVLTTVKGVPGSGTADGGEVGVAPAFSLDGRVGAFVFGPKIAAVATLEQEEVTVGACAGLVLGHSATEWSIVPEVGAHALLGVGQSLLFGKSRFETAFLPYAGLDIGFLRFAGPRGSAMGGLLFARADLAHTKVDTPTQGILGGTDVLHYEVGGLTMGLAFRAQLPD